MVSWSRYPDIKGRGSAPREAVTFVRTPDFDVVWERPCPEFHVTDSSCSCLCLSATLRQADPMSGFVPGVSAGEQCGVEVRVSNSRANRHRLKSWWYMWLISNTFSVLIYRARHDTDCASSAPDKQTMNKQAMTTCTQRGMQQCMYTICIHMWCIQKCTNFLVHFILTRKNYDSARPRLNQIPCH